MPLWLRFDLIEDEWQIFFEIAQTDVAKSIGGRVFHFLVWMVKAVHNNCLKVAGLAQIAGNNKNFKYQIVNLGLSFLHVLSDLSDSQECEGLLVRVGIFAGDVLRKLVDDGNSVGRRLRHHKS